MKQISRARFDAYAGFSRQPEAVLLIRELAWFESDSGAVLAALCLDTDEEYSGALFARDLMGRFRWVKQTSYYADATGAIAAIGPLMGQVESYLELERVQGDETNPVDFFTPVVKEKRFHESFRYLAFGDRFSPARELITLMMRWYENQDGNYVEQFQTTGFDARVWELYLFATLVERGYAVSQPDPAPDFLARGLDGQFYLEATTINPSVVNGQPFPSQKPRTEAALADYVENYLPVRFAGPLTAKLMKRYWEHPGVSGTPLVLAIQDFHDEMSMTYSGVSLPRYLYGLAFDEESTESGVTVAPRTITHHRWKGKEIESCFFDQAGAEHISAVVFNGSGTLAKFNRMGVKVGLGAPTVTLVHTGIRLSSNGNPTGATFESRVTEGYEESWIDGMNVYHNPNALCPLDPGLLPGAAHHHRSRAGIESSIPHGHLISSRTAVVARSY
ncbi:hypothetical protein GCM10025781_26900 [Kocuria gwangalliensis]|uniref:Uncharacterized protein n=1 Tax=Kocuria gwangalliensis TaxID=501592 RepID=A0ABP8XFZ0_9MICC